MIWFVNYRRKYNQSYFVLVCRVLKCLLYFQLTCSVMTYNSQVSIRIKWTCAH